MATTDQEIIDTSWAANSTEREIYEKEIVGFIGSYADHEGQEQQFTKVDFEQALQKVSRKIKK
jgi:hypothetical protein